jgi:hypothetical protein
MRKKTKLDRKETYRILQKLTQIIFFLLFLTHAGHGQYSAFQDSLPSITLIFKHLLINMIKNKIIRFFTIFTPNFNIFPINVKPKRFRHSFLMRINYKTLPCKTIRVVLLLFLSCTILTVKSQDLQTFDKKKPLKITGNLGAQSIFYNVKGIPNRRRPFSYILNGNVNLNFFNIINVPLSFIYSEQERSFQQPFNQLGASPTYKWLTVHAGYRSVRWGEYSLAGYNFLMGGAEVQRKKIRAGLVYGRLNRATKPDTASTEERFILPVLKRMGFAAKAGYGTIDNYIDLVYLRAWDVGDSLRAPAGYASVRPAENAVIDLITRQKFAKYFIFQGEVAFSSTNDFKNDTGKKKTDAITGLVLKQNNSGQAGKSFSGSLMFQKKSVNAEIGMRIQELNFRSFGGYFYNTNYSNYYGRIGYALYKNKIRVNHMFSLMDDNLNRQKNVTTTRIMPNTTVDMQVNSKLGIGAQYNLVMTRQRIENDTLRSSPLNNFLLDQSNHSIGLTPRYTFRKGAYQHMLMLMETYQFVKDRNENTKLYGEMSTNFLNLLYNINLVEKNLGFSLSGFNTRVKNYAVNISTYGISTGANKSFYNGSLTTGGNLSMSFNNQSTVTNFSLNAGSRFAKKHSVSVNAALINNNTKISNAPSFTEYQGRLMYLYSF